MRFWPEKPFSELHFATQKYASGLKSFLQNCIFRRKNAILVLIWEMFFAIKWHPETGFAKPGGAATPPVCERRTSILNIILRTISGWVAHRNLTAQASRLYPHFYLQRNFVFFARMSCSEQSTFHGQASHCVWSFPNCSFKASRRKKKKKKRKS